MLYFSRNYEYAENVELRIYQVQKEAECEKSVYGPTREKELTIKASRKEDILTLQVEATKAYTIRLVNTKVKEVVGAEWTQDGKDVVLRPNKGEIKVSLS